MNRIDRVFERTRSEGRAALIVFVTAGDPDLDTTERMLPLLAEAGADIVELGVPHSDPIGEGPTIQAASVRGLASGATVPRILELVARVRKRSDVPLVLMGYLNNALAYGEEKLIQDAAAVGADGLILSDIPYEEAPALQAACEAKGVHRVLLVTPTSTPERVLQIARRARGFVYCVALTGVTGERADLPPDLEALVGRVRRVTSTPVAVGFGISNASQVARVADLADGVIVGSALVNRIARAGSPAAAIEAAVEFVRELRSGIGATGR
jgi:tryptophan synthase alpha chain